MLDPSDPSTLVLDSTEAEQQEGNVVHINVPTQIERIERMKAAIPPWWPTSSHRRATEGSR